MQHFFFNKVDATHVGERRTKENLKANKSYHSMVTGNGPVHAVYRILYSNINTGEFEFQTVTVDGTDMAQQFLMHADIWHFVHIELVELTGTNALFTLVVGTEM